MSALGDNATALTVQHIIDKGRQLKASFEDVSQPRSDYQLKNFVVGNHETPERKFLQIVLELQRKVVSIRRAQIGLRQLAAKWLEAETADERELLDLDREEAELAMLGAVREFNCLYAMYEACPKFTHEQMQAAEQGYWETRLARQATLDIEAGGRIGVGNLDALRQANMLPNLVERVEDTKARLTPAGNRALQRALVS